MPPERLAWMEETRVSYGVEDVAGADEVLKTASGDEVALVRLDAGVALEGVGEFDTVKELGWICAAGSFGGLEAVAAAAEE